jgi:hypothetical protein
MYQLKKSTLGETIIVKDNNNGSFTSFGEWDDNTDYQAFLKYQAEGGVVLPADDNEQTA